MESAEHPSDQACSSGEDDAPDFVDVVVECAGGAAPTLSLLLNLNSAMTLSDLRKRVAMELKVEAVCPLDYSEDMDDSTLLQLGIGSSEMPFVVELGSSTKDEPAEAAAKEVSAAASHVPTSSGERTSRSPDVRKAADASCQGRSSIPRGMPLAVRQALADASEIRDGWLFLGGSMAAGNLAALQQLNITCVLNCCPRVPCKFKSMKYKVIDVLDTKASDIRQYFPEALAFIDEAAEAKTGILVHCMVGASRSTSLVLAWLVARCQMSLLEAYRHVRARRTCARPNRAFCEQADPGITLHAMVSGKTIT
eukprot:TRINITY_DN24263_c0_g1_i1.p1 TRINITY_DN24263_c0_g1~~TRINITY_DN24263_c0_g1_i1.p1  ORF type:complete len:329 (+),score=65.56 TRINITY_DN24263_c0_g1_i1:61-987(+)